MSNVIFNHNVFSERYEKHKLDYDILFLERHHLASTKYLTYKSTNIEVSLKRLSDEIKYLNQMIIMQAINSKLKNFTRSDHSLVRLKKGFNKFGYYRIYLDNVTSLLKINEETQQLTINLNENENENENEEG